MPDELALRPDFSRFRHIAGIGAGAAFGFGLLVLVQVLGETQRDGPLGGVVLAAALIALVGPMLSGLALYFRNYRLIAGDGYLAKVDLLGRRHVWRRADLHRILYTETWGWGSSSSSDSRMHRRYLLLDSKNKLIAEVPVAGYSDADLKELFDRLQVQPSRLQYTDDVKLGRYYREPLGTAMRHPIWTGGVAAIVMVAGLIGVAILTTPPNQR